MSAFLGPIHHWLFRKIRFQNDLTNYMAEAAEEKGWGDRWMSRMKEVCGVLEQGELEEIIDGSNIHGWLQERIVVVERRLAFLVTGLLHGNPERSQEFGELVLAFGRQYPAETGMSLRETFEYLDSLLLNGMPCDHVNMLTEETETMICWEQRIDIHASYWQEIGGSTVYYYAVRKNLIRGILEHTGVVYEQTGEQSFKLRKEA